MKLSDVLDKITGLQHKIAVYDDILEYLEGYLSSDFEDVSEVIEVSNPCLESVVAVSVIETVQEEIRKNKETFDKELAKLCSLETKDKVKSDGKPRKKK